jgi:sensor histidine kinase regulating citrate/malate metabolism
MQQLWDKTKEQYTFAKENIELINMKCHDFKHQIRTIRTAGTINPDVLQELEGYINIYDSITKTGNEALDVILTEKSLLCNKNNVQFTYIVDGDKLNFMREEDVYALFGNIVDNAIEATMQVEESKRIVNLHVKMVNDMLVIRENNYYVGDLQFENGLPKTTKQDDKYHGFGLKSIKYVTEKYGGSYTLTADDGIFELNIVMFPFKR